MKSRQEKKIDNMEKTTTGDEQKRDKFIKKLCSQSIENFRDVDIDEYDLNITEHFQELEEIDQAVTPLIYCAFFGLKQICKLLLKNKNIDVDLETENNKQTPLITACLCGNYEIVRLLILSKAEVNKPNQLNHIPLTVVLFRLVEEPSSFENKKICFRIADLLIKNGADLNWIIDKKNGYSLLHYFCSLKMKMNKIQIALNYEIIKFLLDKGANIKQLTLKDKNCQQLLEHHCNKDQYCQKSELKVEPKPIKRIDADFFKIVPK